MILMMALIDVIGVASILPFMAVLSNPEIIETSRIINYIFQVTSIFGVENNQQFLFILGIIVFGFLLISENFIIIQTIFEEPISMSPKVPFLIADFNFFLISLCFLKFFIYK